MLRIALCDDDQNFLSGLHQEILLWAQGAGQREWVTVDVFSESKYLDREIKSGSKFDLFFVDVEMPDLDGLTLATQILECIPFAIIVFLTSHCEMALEGYKIGALRYIPKLEMASRLPEALSAALTEFSKLEAGALTVRYYGNAVRIPYREIVYVRHVLRSSQIVTSNQGIIKDNRGLREIYDQLNDERFIYIDRSTFVNLDYIRQIKGNELILRNLERLPISRQMLSTVKDTINRLWGA